MSKEIPWELIGSALLKIKGRELNQFRTFRMQVPGGWLVTTFGSGGHVAQTFLPDPNHEWKLEKPEVTSE